MAQMRLNVQAPIARVFAERWSTRAFDSAQAVERSKLASCLEAARWAPSCYGEQPWRFIVADKHANPNAWEAVLHALAEKNQLWAKNAPVFVVGCAVPRFASTNAPNRWAAYDLGQAVISLCLQATMLGLATHQMGGFDPEKLRRALAIPADIEVMSVVAVGYPAPAQAAPEPFQALERASRTRKPIEEIAFEGAWGRPWQVPDALGWEARYQETPADKLPWFFPELDPDIRKALDALGIRPPKRVLDLGCGPGTQAVALAKMGFEVVATDISWTAVETTKNRAKQAGVAVEALVDDVRASKLEGPFDLIVDRGVFHCFADEEDQKRYLETVRRLLAPEGVLLLKCFHKEETREEGPPGRYDEADIRRLFAGFQLVRAARSQFPNPHGDDPPLALFCILKRA
ncbi:MAG: methyltransferase domain-containing protein [Zetaproteobacteria bacterium]|nr:MAG: methyltransferase domain-containing protein [Zetaproteobacteria bacterium]